MSSILGIGRNSQLSIRSTSEDKEFYLTFVERPIGSSLVLASSEITINPAQDLIGCTSVNTLALKTARTIGGTPFDGTSDITPANAIRATTADTLHTARTIAGVSFDGSGNINIPGVNVSGNLSGNAATASQLATARNIGSVSFNGTQDVPLPWNLLMGGTVQGGIIHRSGDVYIGGATPVVSPSLQGGFFSAFNITSQGALTVLGNSDCQGNLNVDERVIVGSAPGTTGKINVLFTIPNDGTYAPYDPTNPSNPPTNPVMYHRNMCALFSTTIGGVFPRFGVGIGNDVVTGQGFIQTVTNETTPAFHLKLQPQLGNVGIGNGATAPRRPLDAVGTWPQIVATDATNRHTAIMGNYPTGVPHFGGHSYALNAWVFAQFFGGFNPQPSDERIKQNIRDVDLDHTYDQFKKLRAVCYEYKEGFTGLEHSCMNGCQTGFIAQEVERIFPKVIIKYDNMNWGTGELKDFYCIDKGRLGDYANVALLAAMEKIETLEAQVQDLMLKYNTLAARVTDLSLNP